MAKDVTGRGSDGRIQGCVPVEGSFDTGAKKQREFWPRSANGYDLKTGQLKKQVPTGPIFQAEHHHRCYRDKATLRYILCSRRGSEYVDLEQKTFPDGSVEGYFGERYRYAQFEAGKYLEACYLPFARMKARPTSSVRSQPYAVSRPSVCRISRSWSRTSMSNGGRDEGPEKPGFRCQPFVD